MWRLWALMGGCGLLLGLVLTGLHMLQAASDRAFARGHDAGRAELAAQLTQQAAVHGQQSQAALAKADATVASLERDKDALQDQLAHLDVTAQSPTLRQRLCLDAERVRALNAIGGGDPSSGP